MTLEIIWFNCNIDLSHFLCLNFIGLYISFWYIIKVLHKSWPREEMLAYLPWNTLPVQTPPRLVPQGRCQQIWHCFHLAEVSAHLVASHRGDRKVIQIGAGMWLHMVPFPKKSQWRHSEIIKKQTVLEHQIQRIVLKIINFQNF